MANYKYCTCGKRILIHEKRCDDCIKKTYKKYRDNRRDTEFQSFYNSKEWRNKRDKVLTKYKGVDVYAYYQYTLVIPATLSHHIIPIKTEEGFKRRLDFSNLFPLSERSHKEVHRRIDDCKGNKDKLNKLYEELYGLLDRFRSEFNIQVN